MSRADFVLLSEVRAGCPLIPCGEWPNNRCARTHAKKVRGVGIYLVQAAGGLVLDAFEVVSRDDTISLHIEEVFYTK